MNVLHACAHSAAPVVPSGPFSPAVRSADSHAMAKMPDKITPKKVYLLVIRMISSSNLVYGPIHLSAVEPFQVPLSWSTVMDTDS